MGRDVDEDLSAADLRALVDSARALAEETNLDRLPNIILERAADLTDSCDASVLLYRPDLHGLSFVAVSGSNAAALLERWGPDSDQAVPLEGSKAGQVFTTGRPLVSSATEHEANHFKGVDRDIGKTTESMVCVPLAVGDDRLGVVQLLNKRSGDYTNRDLVLLENFTAYAAVAIRNLRLFDDLLAHMGLYGSRQMGIGPAELLEELRQPPRNELLSILFADMRGFSRMSQAVDRPEQLLERLNEFLCLLADSVLEHGGLVNKFLGDGLMALFRGEGHSARAVACAFTIVDAFADLREHWDDTSNAPLDFLDVGIGVATDTVLLGSLGTDRVRDFTAVGSAVALAATLVEQARDGQRVMIDKLTFRQARDVIGAYDGPTSIELRSPGQDAGRRYERYVIRAADDQPPPAATSPNEGGDLFISYSHRDRRWLERLRTHLKPHLRAGDMSLWDDTQIKAGELWMPKIEHALGRAKVAVLLVSPNFLDSDFIAAHEVPPLLEAARDRGTTIFWIPVSASSYDATPLAQFQAACDPRRPLDGLSVPERSKVLVSIARKITEAIAR